MENPGTGGYTTGSPGRIGPRGVVVECANEGSTLRQPIEMHESTKCDGTAGETTDVRES